MFHHTGAFLEEMLGFVSFIILIELFNSDCIAVDLSKKTPTLYTVPYRATALPIISTEVSVGVIPMTIKSF